MIEVKVSDATLQDAAEKGMDAFLAVVIDAVRQAIGGELTAETMAQLNADQITLLAWDALHEEVMDGGFVQLIHNGYGGFIYRNPTARAFRQWNVPELATLINHTHKLYSKYREQIERECTDEEFMALFEQMPEFDACDDKFVEHEEQWTAMIACYVDDHLADFVTIEKE